MRATANKTVENTARGREKNSPHFSSSAALCCAVFAPQTFFSLSPPIAQHNCVESPSTRFPSTNRVRNPKLMFTLLATAKNREDRMKCKSCATISSGRKRSSRNSVERGGSLRESELACNWWRWWWWWWSKSERDLLQIVAKCRNNYNLCAFFFSRAHSLYSVHRASMWNELWQCSNRGELLWFIKSK